jgi:biotin operon repressor
MARKAKAQYTGREVWVNQATGEVREVDAFEKPVGRDKGFMITYLAEIINMIETLGTKKMLVVKYILQNMCKANNTLIATTREIAKELGMSTTTVNDTLKLLEGAGIIERRTGAIMVSPKLCNNWNSGKEASMMIKYYEFSGEEGGADE